MSVGRYISWKDTVSHRLGQVAEDITSTNLQEVLTPYERVLTRPSGRVTASPLTTKMISLPWLEDMTSYEGRYRLGYRHDVSIGTLIIYEEHTEEVLLQRRLFLMSLAGLVILSLLTYFLTRGIIWYGFAGLERIATYCAQIGDRIAGGDSSSLETTTLLVWSESNEIQTVAEAVSSMTEQIYTYIQQQQVFTHGMSHEFKTQLMQVQSDLDVAKDVVQDPVVFAEIQDSLRGFRGLIDQLLLLATHAQELQKSKREQVVIKDIVTLHLERHAEMIGEKNLVVGNLLTGEEEVLCYPVLFDAIVGNLVSNAVKYTPVWWNITLAMQEERLVVSNTVVSGFSDGDAQEMFDLFRVKDRARSDVASHGIWGALIKKLVEVHGWEVSAHIEKGMLAISLHIPTE